MLHFIFGQDGTGKSASLREFALHLAARGKEVLFVVPEQCSFLSEKYFYGKENSGNINVSSFERMKRRIFLSFGKTAVQPIGAPEKNMLMWKAVRETGDLIKVMGKSLGRPETVAKLTEFSDMLKSFGVSPSEFYNGVPEENAVLKQKAEDIQYILDTYEALLGNRFMDETGSVMAAVKLIREKGNSGIFPDTVIFDEFWYFTGEQRELIGYLLSEGNEVYISVEAPSDRNSSMYGVFSLPDKTKNSLIALCDKYSVEYTVERVMTEDRKHISGGLISISKDYIGEIYEKDSSGVTVIECPDGYSEALFAAAKINELVREENLCYSDFAVLVSDEDSYAEAIEDAFRKYGIPLYRDTKSPLINKKIVTFARLFLNQVIRPDSDAYISMAKSGFVDITEKEISDIEDYVFKWDLKGRDWEKDFTLDPDGFSFNGKDPEKTKEELLYLNALRKKITAPVKNFRSCGKGKSVDALTELLYEELWHGYGITERIRENYSGEEYLSAEGKILLTREKQVLTAFCEMLDSIHDCLGGTYADFEEYLSLFTLYASLSKVGSVPQNKDAVVVSEPGRMRTDSVRAVFVIGAYDGGFPGGVGETGIFTKKEKAILKNERFDFIKTSEDAYLEELFTVYKTLMLPSEKLFITYPVSSFSGDEISASELIPEVLRMTNQSKAVMFKDLDRRIFIMSEDGAFSEMTKCFNENTPFSAALRSFFMNSDKKSSVSALERATVQASDRVEDKELLNKLYPDVMRISASKAEMFHKCKFAYFCRYAIGLKPRQKAELSPQITGTLIHYILEKLIGLVHNSNADRSNIDAELKILMEDCFESFLGGIEGKDARFLRAYNRLYKMLKRLIIRMLDEFEESDFVPSDFELGIAESEDISPLEFTSVSGKKVIIEGSVDRVDIYKKNGVKYVRVIDYKSGQKDFKLSEVMEGINMQMLIYLAAITENGKHKYEGAVPAGILYMPAKDPGLAAGRRASEEEIIDYMQKSYQMKGLLLNDEEVLTAMEHGLAGRFIPVKYSGGAIKSSSLGSFKEFGYLKKHIFSTLKTMAGEISGADPKIEPIEFTDGRRPCEYCDYKGVCGATESCTSRKITTSKNEEILNRLGEKYGEKMD